MLVFPKYLAGFVDFELTHQPPCLPFEKRGDQFDFTRPVSAYFDLLDERIAQLKTLGVQADVILFHNYDFGMWGIDDQLTDEAAEWYLDYLIARIGAHSNVWWSLANEYDLQKKPDGSGCYSRLDRRDWDRIGRYVYDNDPYHKPISVHNLGPVYPDANWLSHVSVQFPNTYSLLLELQHRYNKPVINDEYQYEGNLIDNWGNLSGEEETIRHYLSLMAGCYATHGECYVIGDNNRDIFWTYGGKMHGQSAARISYLKRLAERMPFSDMIPDHTIGDGRYKFCLRCANKQIFMLYTPDCPERDRVIGLGVTDGKPRKYRVTVYDLWNMSALRSFEYGHGTLVNPKRDESGKPIEDPLKLKEQGLLGVYFEQLI